MILILLGRRTRRSNASETIYDFLGLLLRPLRIKPGLRSPAVLRRPRLSHIMTTQAEVPPTITVPEGFSLHSENTSHILLPNDNGAFLNPVQEFNRDMSVAAIRTWGEQMNELKKHKWEQARDKKANKRAKRQKSEWILYASYLHLLLIVLCLRGR